MQTYLKEKIQVSKVTSWIGMIASLIALTSAFTIMVEKLHLLANPNYVTSCSVNAIISCSPVMSSHQASVFFGIPNPLLGIAGFSVVAFLYFVSFFTALPRLIWVVNAMGTALALTFCFWLATQALYVINAICIYCFIVWIMTTIIFWLGLKPVLKGTRFSDLQLWVVMATVLTVIAFLTMIYFAFSDYWLSLLQ